MNLKVRYIIKRESRNDAMYTGSDELLKPPIWTDFNWNASQRFVRRGIYKNTECSIWQARPEVSFIRYFQSFASSRSSQLQTWQQVAQYFWSHMRLQKRQNCHISPEHETFQSLRTVVLKFKFHRSPGTQLILKVQANGYQRGSDNWMLGCSYYEIWLLQTWWIQTKPGRFTVQALLTCSWRCSW